MELTELKEIGLTKGEIKVYSALLELGECTKTALAKKAGIAPSNIYDVTNRLIEKGIISKVEKNGVAHFSPANPRRILDFVDQKQKDIENEKEAVNRLLPALLAKFGRSEERVNVEVFQGWNGLKTVFEDLLEECSRGDINYVFGASIGESVERADRFFLRYSKLREKKGIMTKIIFNEALKYRKDRIGFFLKSKKYDVRFLDQATPTEIMTYKDRTCIIILTKDPIVTRITGNEVADSFIQYFNAMWAISKR